MSGPILNETIRAAGGADMLRIRTSQLSVSNWPRARSERALSAKAATGIGPNILRQRASVTKLI